MNINKQIKQVFGLKKCVPKDQQEDPQGNSLGLISYPSLYHISFFITQENLVSGKTKRLFISQIDVATAIKWKRFFYLAIKFLVFYFPEKRNFFLKESLTVSNMLKINFVS